ncbi:hypothetical protein ACSLNK_15875, partial [Escherichia coli]
RLTTSSCSFSGRGDKDIFTVHDILKARGEI